MYTLNVSRKQPSVPSDLVIRFKCVSMAFTTVRNFAHHLTRLRTESTTEKVHNSAVAAAVMHSSRSILCVTVNNAFAQAGLDPCCVCLCFMPLVFVVGLACAELCISDLNFRGLSTLHVQILAIKHYAHFSKSITS